MAFGVACEALLYPNHEPSLMLIPKVIYKPYWQMYGELFLEEIEGRLDNETCQAEPRLNGHCPPIYIFQKVNDKSETIWRFYRYELIYEYFDRPTLVPPLIFFNHIWRLYWYIVSRCRGSPNPSTDFKLKLDEDEVLELNNFEKKQVDNYFIKKQKNTDLIPEIRMQKTGQRLDQVMLELEDIRESVTTGHWGGTGRISDSAVSLQDVARKVMSSQRSPSESFISGLATDNTDSRNDELKERVEKLEGNMENIIDLLNSIQTTQQEMIKVEKEKVLKEAKEVHHVYYTQTPQTKHSKHNLHDNEEQRQLLRLGSSFEGVDTTDHAEPGLSESTYKKLILQGSLPLSPGSSHAVSIDKVDSDYQRQPPLTYRERLLQGSLPTSPASTVDGDLDTGLTHQKKLHRHPTSSSLPHAVSTEYEPQTYRDQLLYGTAPSLPSEAWLSKSRIKQKEKPPSQLSYREQLIHGCPKSGTDEHHSDSNL
uniref:Transient receptor potential cation channel subfamily M member 3-like n=1 Tax=Saccoglossus kowalevskii TaxID=10224 RepID=A0ABM0MUD6_SACKO|nr:PREDICTED: transient receptor potential cation channel subfamily M member 3-like [Saccoglossus kowalevskii]